MTDAELLERIRLDVYDTLAATGAAPSREEIAEFEGIPVDEVDAAFEELEAAHHLVFDEDGEIVLAHPFATRNFGFSVMGERTLYWGGCAWDAFAIPNLVDDEPSALVATQCPGCGRPHAWVVDRSGPPAGDQVVHFPTDAVHVWDDVVRTCSMQRIFCSIDHVRDWSERTGVPVGATFDLATLWRLASRWYEGRLDSPYTRRDPATALRFFQDVGLPREFWGGLEA